MKSFVNKYGRRIRCIGFSDMDIAGTYITANGWTGERHIVASAHKSLNAMECSLILIDVETGDCRCIVENAKWPCFCVKDDILYHTLENRIYRIDLKSNDGEMIYENTGEAPFEGPPGITLDGRYISLQHQDKNGNTSIDLFSTENKYLDEVYHSEFFSPFPKATHSMVNPTDHNEIFFCHEGDCRYITNRMWIYRRSSKRAENFYRQRLDKNGANGDCSGHEMWAESGHNMFFVKYAASTIEPKGIFKISTADGYAEHIVGGYPYWHVGVYKNGELLAGDTMEKNGNVHVVLIHGSQEEIIADAKTTWSHPVHPHPVFSPSGEKLYFTTMGSTGRSVINICEI